VFEGLYVSNWGTYAYLPSGNIISSDIEQGLFVFELGGVSILHDDIQDIDDLQIPYVYFSANVESFDGEVENVTLHYSLDNNNWNDTAMFDNSNNGEYSATMTFDQSNIIVYYYITASNNLGQSSQYPQIDDYVSFNYGDLADILIQDFENEHNWYVESSASSGIWELGIPNGSLNNNTLFKTTIRYA
jgi:hypothetical protein